MLLERENLHVWREKIFLVIRPEKLLRINGRQFFPKPARFFRAVARFSFFAFSPRGGGCYHVMGSICHVM